MEDQKRRKVIVTETGTIGIEVERSVCLDVPAVWDEETIRSVAVEKLDQAQWQECWGVLTANEVNGLDRAVGIEFNDEEPEIKDGEESWDCPVIVCDEKDIPREEEVVEQ